MRVPPPLRHQAIQPKNNWWFVLGHEPLLSAAEIFSLLNVSADTLFTYNETILSIESLAVEPLALIHRLGGTVKIAEQVATDVSEETLITHLVRLAGTVEGKINFGVSFYDKSVGARHILPELEEWAKEVKKQLKDAGRSVRYIAGDEPILNSATVYHNHLDTKGREFIVVPADNNTFSLAVTKAVQPLEALSNRDFGRPGRDDVSGMLPPKLALMMINLASGNSKLGIGDLTLLDPFCGSGTILTEAMRLGITHLVGTDVSDRAIEDTKKNVAWTKSHLSSVGVDCSQPLLQVGDVNALSKIVPLHSIDAIVTEPYMGPPLKGRETPEQIKKTCQELADLYINAFSEFTKILKPGASIVFIIPRFTVRDTRYTISDKIIPKLKELGFEKTRMLPESLSPASYILYQRPKQFVGREIWKFTLQKKSP